MKEYVEESKKAMEEKSFGESYDKEWALEDEARREGRKEGIKEGIQDGRKKRNIEIAKKLFEKKYPLEEIMEITELTEEEIQNLK